MVRVYEDFDVENGEYLDVLCSSIKEVGVKNGNMDFMKITCDDILSAIDVWEHEDCIGNNPDCFVIMVFEDDVTLDCMSCNSVVFSAKEYYSTK